MVLFADIFETVVGSLFLILWIAAQLLGGRQEAKRKKQPARPRPRQPQPVDLVEVAAKPKNRGPRNQGPRNQEEVLRSEVEDFLRRAQGQPDRPQPTLTPAATRQIQPVRPKPLQSQQAVPVETRSLRSEGVAEHVARHLSTGDIAEHTKTLGADVATSDDRLESRLQEKFDHSVGRLAHRETPADTKRQEVNVAAEVAEMLRSPEGMRQLIVANEILRRPEW